MNITVDLIKTREELEAYYTDLDSRNQSEELLGLLREMPELKRGCTPAELKITAMKVLTENSRRKIFRFYPFWHEFTAGRERYNWGGLNPCSQFVLDVLGGKNLKEYEEYFREDRENGYIHNWNNPVGLDHHCPNYDWVLQYGLNGLKEKAERLSEGSDPEKKTFLQGTVEALSVLTGLSERFAEDARILLSQETDPEAKENLQWIAETAARVPKEKPETFYEALASIVFVRECVGTLEGIGVSTYGHLDRMLEPYYEKDLAAGRITEQEAKLLFKKLFLYTGVRFNEETEYHETSTTVILGGCDRNGTVVCNDVTRIILDALSEIRTCGVKFDCRISKEHPAWYIEKLSRIVISGLPVLVFMNDEVHVKARVRHGQAVEDARLYVAGGCHEYVLGGTEVCTRADTWINITRILMDTLTKQEYPDFETLLSEAVEDVHRYHEKIVAAKNKVECRWSEIDPMPLYSAMMADCMEKGRDLTAGGARYNSTALSMVGPANFTDALFTVKKLCFETHEFTPRELVKLLSEDSPEAENLHQRIINRLPKYGTGNAEVDAFTKDVLHRLSQVSGQKNGRGGLYYPAFYAHDIYAPLGNHTDATPDGRRKGSDLSRGCSASEFVKDITPLHMLQSVKEIDFTDFTDSFALEVTLTKMPEEKGIAIMKTIVDGFLAAEGSTLQVNSYDVEMLKEADAHPEEHRNLIVRVCGYSAAFTALTKSQRKGIIERESRM